MLGLKISNSQNKPARHDREEEDVGNRRNLIRTKEIDSTDLMLIQKRFPIESKEKQESTGENNKSKNRISPKPENT